MKIKEFLLQKVNKDTLKKESVQRAIKVTICCVFIFALIFQLVGCLFGSLSVYAVDDDSIVGLWVFNDIISRPTFEYNEIPVYFYCDIMEFSNQFRIDDKFWSSLGYIQDDKLVYYNNDYGQQPVYNFSNNTWYGGDLYKTIFIVADTSDTTVKSWIRENGEKLDTCPTLPELLRDYTGSFDSIVDMLNPSNYDQYEETIRFYEQRAYNEGVSASFGENLLGATFNAPLTALNQWVLFETTGGLEITMGGVFSGLLALSILIILIKMFAGG